MATDSSDRKNAPRRRALITGASAGIGEAFAEKLAVQDYDLIVVARRGDRLEALAKRLQETRGVDVEVFPADLTQADELRSVEDKIASEPNLELVVNNAGFGTAGELKDADPEAEEREIRLNVLALVRLTRAALPGMIERGRGAVVNVSSMAAFSPSPYMATYAATKAFVNHFTEAVYEELRGTPVKIQVLCPGFTRTEFQQVADVDANEIPSMLWQPPEAVVEASLAGLESGTLVVVPGFGNRAATALGSLVPRSVLRRMTGLAMKRSVEKGA